MKTYLLISCILLLPCIPMLVYAQQTSKIEGTVKDTKQTLPAASILLYAVADSSLVSSTMTDENGGFSIAAVPGNYYIVSTCVGYDKIKSNVISLTAAAFQVPAIVLTESSRQLSTVNITASKPVLERKGEKIIFNVDATPSAAGLSALELLRKAPGVTVDYNENISLAGKSNVLVTIDGKLTYMGTNEVVNLLKSMQSNQIESVEVINNPSAKYEANSTGGIINIKTKKSKSEGFNGSFALGGGFNKYLGTDNSLDLNLRKKAFNLFGSYGFNSRKEEEEMILNRIAAGGDESLFFTQHQNDTTTSSAHNFKVGTDFFLSAHHTIGFLFKGNISDQDQKSFSNINIGPSFTKVDSVLKTPSMANGHRENLSYNVNYKGILDTLGQEVSVDLDYNTFDGKNNASYQNNFFLPNGDFFKNGDSYRNFAPAEINIKAAKIDYTLPLNSKLNLEAGVKAAMVESDNNYLFENFKDNSWVTDADRSNHFVYKEKVNAAYAILNVSLGKATIRGGLRIEHTNSKGSSITTNEVNEKSYTDFFPSLIINRSFDEDHELNFSYSRKVNRPNYQNLNPFVFYLDQYTYQEGNPDLKPEYSNNLELSFLLKQKYSFSLGYTRTTDVINQVLLQDAVTKSIHQTYLNLASDEVASLTLNFPVVLAQWWKMNNNLLGFYRRVKADNLNGVDLNSKKLSGNFYSQQNFTLNKLFSADVGLMFSTPQVHGAFIIKSMFSTDAGMRYSFPNQNGSLKLGVSDVFHTQKTRVYSNLPGNIYDLQQFGTTTNVKLTFTYRIGSNTVKSARERSTGVDAEQKRLGRN